MAAKAKTKKVAPKKAAPKKAAPKKAAPKKVAPKKVKLLSGGNPQIAKGDGDGPVQAYLAALPGWKRATGVRVDRLVTRTVPGVKKAVKWNSPFYGVEGRGWFLSVHAFTRFVRLGFFRGASLEPRPPGESKHADTRYLDLYEDAPLDEAQLARWLAQAAALPGWMA